MAKIGNDWQYQELMRMWSTCIKGSDINDNFIIKLSTNKVKQSKAQIS